MNKATFNGINKILITGGAGFIGSHVVDELLAAGYQVRVMDNLASPTHDGKIPEWLNKKAEFFRGDVRKKVDWADALLGVDAVVHLAAYMDYHLDFSTYVRTNIESIALLFEVILEKKLQIKKIIAASSQSVYGDGKYRCENCGIIYPSARTEAQLAVHQWEMLCTKCGRVLLPLAELEDDVLSPQIPYGICKLTSEQLLFNLGKRYGFPVVALRFSIVLGVRQSFRHFYSGALRSFTVNALNREPILMHEDGLQSRDFVSVHDIARAHLLVLEDGRADFNVFNVGSGQATKIINLATIVAKEAGVEFKPSLPGLFRLGNARHSPMNINKLKNLGWEPKVSLIEMAEEYLRWISQFGNLKEYLNKSNDELKKEGILKGL